MRKTDMKGAALFLGALVLLAGVTVVVGSTSGDWTVQSAASKITGLIAGGFLCVIGVVVIGAALDVLDDLSGMLQDIWDSFLNAIRR